MVADLGHARDIMSFLLPGSGKIQDGKHTVYGRDYNFTVISVRRYRYMQDGDLECNRSHKVGYDV